VREKIDKKQKVEGITTALTPALSSKERG